MLKKASLLAMIFMACFLVSFTGSNKKKKKSTHHRKRKVLFIDDTFGKVKDVAKDEDKPMFVFISAPYCNISRRMDRVFKKPEVKGFLMDNYVCTQLDVTNVFKNIRASNWGISAVPTYVILNKDGDIIYKASGFKEAEQIISEADKALADMGIEKKEKEDVAVNPEKKDQKE